MGSWIFIYSLDYSQKVIIYFVVQIVSTLTIGTSFRLVPESFRHVRIHSPSPGLLAHPDLSLYNVLQAHPPQEPQS